MRKVLRPLIGPAVLTFILLLVDRQMAAAQTSASTTTQNSTSAQAYPYETTPNFKETTTIGFPVGLNVYYSDKFAFSYEFTPSIVAQKPSGKPGASKTSNLLFDPGPMFRFKNNFNIIARLAFETAGRYGFTPVFNKVYLKTKAVNYFVALSLPARFGNNAPASIGANVQFGFTFN